MNQTVEFEPVFELIRKIANETAEHKRNQPNPRYMYCKYGHVRANNVTKHNQCKTCLTEREIKRKRGIYRLSVHFQIDVNAADLQDAIKHVKAQLPESARVNGRRRRRR